VVTTRSVLIYVKDKAAALRELYRVLRPGGRISLFEPINRLMSRQPGYLRPLVESGTGQERTAFAYLTAVRG
jgi:ubiquinone/menaquinone biosynthesis C-methylase UbiE